MDESCEGSAFCSRRRRKSTARMLCPVELRRIRMGLDRRRRSSASARCPRRSWHERRSGTGLRRRCERGAGCEPTVIVSRCLRRGAERSAGRLRLRRRGSGRCPSSFRVATDPRFGSIVKIWTPAVPSASETCRLTTAISATSRTAAIVLMRDSSFAVPNGSAGNGMIAASQVTPARAGLSSACVSPGRSSSHRRRRGLRRSRRSTRAHGTGLPVATAGEGHRRAEPDRSAERRARMTSGHPRDRVRPGGVTTCRRGASR